MTDATQKTRPIAIRTPLGDEDSLLLVSIKGVEEISRLFRFHLRLASDVHEFIDPRDIVGKPVSFLVRDLNEQPRHFHGHVHRFVYCGRDDRLNHFAAEVVPWLWFLTRTTNCRIFQNKTVEEIVKQVFADHGFSDYDFRLTGNHPEREYCVQYRETDFNFVSRLLEEEGVFYFFRHEEERHVLILADAAAEYQDCTGDDREIDLIATLRDRDELEQIWEWQHEFEYRSGKYTHTDFDFEKPSTALETSQDTILDIDQVHGYELYDYPGGYLQKGDGDALAKVRMEEDETPHDVFTGKSICHSFGPGCRFTIGRHHCPDEEGKSYVLTRVEHEVSVGTTYETKTDGQMLDTLDYRNTFRCIPDTFTFRPERITPKAVVHGAQTAIVVGPDGEEIYTDEYGRVKVQFHWDREGESDEKSSCWVRVAQVWAGHKWGAMFIPRIGQEVMVDFLEGDPDRPIITGRVYNAEQMPPYALPDRKTVSTLKSLSSKDGGGFNELRFEDKKGDEQIFIHGEKDEDIRIKNDAREWIGNDRHLTVKGDQRERVEGAQHLFVKGNQHEQIDGSVRLLIGDGGGGGHEIVVTGEKRERIGSDSHLQVGSDRNEEIAGNQSLTVSGSQQEKVGSKHALDAGQEIHLKAGMKVILEAGVQLTIKGPGGFVDIGPAGVTIQGNLVRINSGGAAGSGGGSSPTTPKAARKASPTEPDEAEEGQVP